MKKSIGKGISVLYYPEQGEVSALPIICIFVVKFSLDPSIIKLCGSLWAKTKCLSLIIKAFTIDKGKSSLETVLDVIKESSKFASYSGSIFGITYSSLSLWNPHRPCTPRCGGSPGTPLDHHIPF